MFRCHIACLTLIFTLIVASAQADAALVAYWNMNEAAGTIADSSGNGHTGTPSATGLLYGQSTVPTGTYGSLTVSPTVAAAFGNAIDFTRADAASFAVAATPTLESLLETGGTSNFTIMAWVRTDALPSSTTYRIFATGPGSGWGFGAADVDRIRFTTFGNTDFTSTGTVPTNLGWHHLAVTVAGTSGTMYADGNSIGTFTIGGFGDESATVYRIGSSVGGTGDLFDGQIDELKIFNTALSESEVRAAAVSVTAIPEPTFLGAVLVALCSAAGLRWRAQSQRTL